MATILDPTPSAHIVKLSTPLTTAYFRHLYDLYYLAGDEAPRGPRQPDAEWPATGDNFFVPRRGAMWITRVEIAEPEGGRGLIFVVCSGDPHTARRAVEKAVAAAEARFNDRERAMLAEEKSIAREAVLDDAAMGI